MSLAKKAFIGALWNVAATAGARVVGVIGTLIITRFLAPEVMAEVTAAAILIATANLVTNFGFGNYYIVNDDEPEIAFHMTALHLSFAVIAFAAVFLVADLASAIFGVPTMTQYIPGMLVATALRRLSDLPRNVLAKQLSFRRIGAAATLGELSYVLVSVSLAANGWGGHAMVIGNIVQAVTGALVLTTGVHWRTWLLPCRLRWQRIASMMRFGVPLGVTATFEYASSSWDNLLFARYFGANEMGLYHLAYKLASIPGEQLGEHAGAVILPSLSQIEDPQARKDALVRATGLMALLVFPLAIGLSSVAESLVVTVLPENWHGTAPLVTILAAISVFQPISWNMHAYWIAESQTRLMMAIQLGKITLLSLGIVLMAQYGPLWICVTVGAVFATNAVVSVVVCALMAKIPVHRFWRGFWQPLLACVPMVAAVMAARYGLRALGVEAPLAFLLTEIVAGAMAYVPAALILAPTIAQDFLGLVKKVFSRDRGND